MQLLLNHIAQQLSVHFNQSVYIQDQTQVFGGDINRTFHLQTNIGSFFLKLNESHFKDMFEKEFDGLQLLHQTKTIKVPKPILYGNFEGNIFLVIEFIKKGNTPNNFWKIFAYQLADLHKNSNDSFGLSNNNYIGSLHQQNNCCESWSEFYATQRLMPLVQLAFNQNKLNKQDILLADKLYKRLYNLFPEEQPALVHGDLWSGNFMADKNESPVIYDPAVYYGNREMDIALSLLFHGFDSSFYDYYNEAFPLQPDWKERVPLCQLYPLLMHLVLFGGSYYNNVMRIIKSYV